MNDVESPSHPPQLPLPRVFYTKWLTVMFRRDSKPNSGQQYHEDEQPKHKKRNMHIVLGHGAFMVTTARCCSSTELILSMGVELLKGKVSWRAEQHPVEEAMMGMWGQLGYCTYHPNDHQSGDGWSIWLERCPLPPSVRQTHFTKNCMLCSGGWSSWEKEKCSWVKSYQAAVLCQNLQINSDKAMIKMLQVDKVKNPSRARRGLSGAHEGIWLFLENFKKYQGMIKRLFLIGKHSGWYKACLAF